MAKPTGVVANIIDPVQISDSLTTYYTSPSAPGLYSKIEEMTVANDTTTAITFSVYKVPVGGSADDTNILVKNQALASGDAFSITELLGKIYLKPGMFIRAIASVAAQATLHISGFDYS